MGYVFAEHQSNLYADKIANGLEENALKFLSTGGQRTLGFKANENKEFYIDEHEAIIVRKIFEMYVDKNSMAEIIRYLNSQGFKTAKGNKFNKNSINRILTNKRYIGTYIFRGVEYQNKMPRIIENDLFNKAQEVMKKNKKAPARARATEDYLLTTKLFCGYCKKMMVGTSGTSRNGSKHSYYKCKNSKNNCHKKTEQKEFIENLILKTIRDELTEKNIKTIATNIIKVCKQAQDNTLYNRLKKAQRDNLKKLDNMILAVAECENSETRKLYEKKIEELQSEKKILDKELFEEENKQLNITVADVKYFLTEMKDGSITDIRYKKMLIECFVNQIYLYDDKFIAILNISSKPVEIEKPLFDDIECSLMGRLAPPK